MSSTILTREPLFTERPVVFRHLAEEIPSTTYATFGLYRYPAKFIPHVISYALKTYARPGMSVFDPFSGYGTVGVVARLYGNDYELWDLNPLLKHLHAVSIMKPINADVDGIVHKMTSWKKEFIPDWSNVAYWFPEEVLHQIKRIWGFYHSLEDARIKQILLVPLLKTTRVFSYNDAKRQKLSRSRIAERKVQTILAKDWHHFLFRMIRDGLRDVLEKLHEYQELNPKSVRSTVKAGVDGLSLTLEKERDILITSPPYLQAQEYIRATKMDLFWLGYPEATIKELGKKEIPYREVPVCEIYSPTYRHCLKHITEEHMRQVFERYFCGILGALTRHQEKVRDRMLLFVGSATIRSKPIPIGQIFAEHFSAYGWTHEVTLVDTIVSRAMFFYKENPATGLNDKRMSTEHLVVLSRRR